MHLLRNIFRLYHETPGGVPSGGAPPDPGASGGAGTAVAPGTPPPGQGPPQPGGDGIRQFFPNVPDDQWAIMEPHVQQMGGQITQLQQVVAPLREALQAGYDGAHLARLASFDQRFRTNPTETWIEIGRNLQQSVDGRPPAVDPNVDLEYLAALARGEDPDAAPGGGQPPQPGAQPGQAPAGASPEVMAYVQQLEAKLTEVQQGLQQDRSDRQTQVQDAVFDRQIGRMRDTLKKVGWPEERLTQQALTARVLVHGGRFDQATQAMVEERNDLLKGWTQNRTEQPNPTNMPNGAPTSPNRDVRTRDERDSFKRGTRNAAARLARLNGGTRG